MSEKEFLKEHPSLKDKFCEGFSEYDPTTWKIIHETQLDKQKVEDEVRKSREYHANQLELNKPIASVVAHHHEIIIDFIDNELKERLGIK